MKKFAYPLLVLGMLFPGITLKADDAAGKVKLHAIFGDNMVVQRDVSVPVWGTALPGKRLTVKFDSQEKSAVADKAGKWKIIFAPVKAGGPYTLTVSSSDGGSIALAGILAGDVWFCSGQSNMGWKVRHSNNSQKEIEEARYPEIRLFIVEDANTPEPMDDLLGKWRICSPETVGDFSAAGYYLGRDLFKELGIPIGLIDAAWGGSAAEQWTPLEMLFGETRNNFNNKAKQFHAALEHWQKTYAGKIDSEDRHLDSGNQGFAKGWGNPDFDDKGWKEMNLPGYYEKESPEMKIDGAVWFRKHLRIPESLTGKELLVSLGAIDDFDVTYFNGSQIGTTGGEIPQYWNKQRQYKIPADLVKGGEAVIAVRVFDNFGGGGFGGKAENLFVTEKEGTENISLSGSWKYNVEYALMEKPSLFGTSIFGKLFNGMIHPLLSFPIKGVIWYQGESNVDRAGDYPVLLSNMIKSWREGWNLGNFPFYMVQLANFMPPPNEPEESAWAELREAQETTAREVPNCGIVTAIDIGNEKNIHPKNKQEVGRRLALAALKNSYGKDIVASGPVYDKYSTEGNKLRISFKELGGGLVTKSGAPLKQFSIAGADRKFAWAQAEIDENAVLVWSEQIPKPVAVRYAWANNPEGANLYNKAGLPAFPFRTDNWPGISAPNKN